MAKEKHTEEQIRAILAEQTGGMSAKDIAKKHKISSATFYNWKSRYGSEGGQESADAPKRGRPKGSRNKAAAKKRADRAPMPVAKIAKQADEVVRLKLLIADLLLEVRELRGGSATR